MKTKNSIYSLSAELDALEEQLQPYVDSWLEGKMPSREDYNNNRLIPLCNQYLNVHRRYKKALAQKEKKVDRLLAVIRRAEKQLEQIYGSPVTV